MDTQILYIGAGALLLFFLIIILLIILKSKQKKSKVKQSLNMVLFSVKISPKTDEELQREGKQEKEWISMMEHLYSSLTALKKEGIFNEDPWISFELMKIKNQIKFFVAAPRRYSDFIQKQILSISPDAEVVETDDFNIFAEDEDVDCGYLTLKRPFYLPIKTYLKMEGDPLSNITNILTQLKEGEEGGIQVIVKNTSNEWKTRGQRILSELSKGKSFNKAFSDSGLAGLLKGEEKEPFNGVPDQEIIEAIQNKVSKKAFETNVRIFVSTKSKETSEHDFYQIANIFEQFSSPMLNSFNIIKAKKRQFRKLAFDFSFRTFNKENSMILDVSELSSIFHFQTPFTKTPHLEDLDSKSAPAPSNIPSAGLILGYNEYRGTKTEIKIERDDRRRHLYTIGQTGTGKSAFLSNMIIQDIRAGNGVGIIDPHGDLIEDILGCIPKERLKDVVLFDPGDLERCVSINMLEYDKSHPEQKTFIVNELMAIFDKLYDLKKTGGPMFEQYAKNALLLLMDDPEETYTLIEVPRVLSDAAFRRRLLLKCKNIIVKDFWEKEAEKAGGEASLANMVPYITSKFNTFITNDYVRPIIGQEKSTFNFRDIMDQKKILLVNLSKGRLGDINSALLGLIIVGKLTISAFSRVDLPENERQDFYLYIDEFQNFATDSISTILSEARKYRLCLTVSHQFIGQLPEMIRDSIFGNIGTMVSFRIGVEDAEFMQNQFAPTFTRGDLINQNNFHYYLKLMVSGKVSKPFDVKTYPPFETNRELATKIKKYYMLKEGKERGIVEKTIHERIRRI